MSITLKNVRRQVAGLSLAFLIASMFAVSVAQAATFTDVQPSDWFYPYVEDLAAKEILNTSFSNYRPSDMVKRDEMAKLAVEAFNIPLETPTVAPFKDVPLGQWNTSYIYTAQKNGIIGGYQDTNGTLTGYYGPGDSLTREQAMKILVLAAPLPIVTSGGPHFPDVALSAWSYEYVETGYNWSVVSGYLNGNFGPRDNVRRSEIAKMVSNAMNPVLLPGANGFAIESVTALSATSMEVCYTSAVDAVTAANKVNYVVKDTSNVVLPVTAAVLSADGLCVTLTTGSQTTGKTYGLVVTGVNSAGDVALPANNAQFVGFGSAQTIGGDLSVQKSADTPVAAVVPSNSTRVDFLKFDLSANADPVTVDTIVVKRVGVGAYNDITGVYLYEGNVRLTNSRTISSDTNEVEFSNLKLAIGANSTRTITVAASIGDNKSGTHAFQITAAASITSNAKSVSGSFPIIGNTMTINATSAGTVLVEKQGTMSNPSIGDMGVPVAQFKLTTNSEDGYFTSITLKQDEDIDTSLLSNFALYQGTTLVPSTASVDGRYVTITLTTPFKLVNGSSKNFTVKADISSNTEAGKKIAFHVNNAADVLVTGASYNFGLKADITAWDTLLEAQTLTVQGGGIVISQQSAAAGDIKTNSTSVELMRVAVKANVDTVEIQKMTLGIATTSSGLYGIYKDTNGNTDQDSGEPTLLKNIKIKDATTGQTLGSSKQLADGGFVTTDPTNKTLTFTYDDYFTVNKGATRILIVTADIDSNQTSGVVYKASLDFTGANFTVKDSQDTTVTDIVPSTIISGNNMTTQTSALTISRAATPETRTVVKGSTVDALGLIFATGKGVGNDVQLSGLSLNTYVSGDSAGAFVSNIDTDDGGVQANNLIQEVNLYADGVLIAGPVSVDTAGKAIFTSNKFVGGFYTIPAGTNKTIIVQAKVSSTAPYGAVDDSFSFSFVAANVTADDANSSVTPTVTCTEANGTGGPPCNALLPAVSIRVTGGGVLSNSLNGGTPDAQTVVAGLSTATELGRVTFNPTKEAYLIDKLAIQVGPDASAVDDVASLRLYDTSGLPLSDAVSPDAAGLVTFTNLSINAPKSTDTVVVIKGTLTAIGERTVPTDGTAGAGADTGDIVNVSVSTFADNFHAVGQSSSTVDNVADATLGKDMTVRKSKLVVAREALSSSVLTNGVGVSLMRFTVTADANGAVVIGAIKPAMALGGTAAITAATVKIFDVTGGSDTAMNAVGVNASAIVKFDTPREIAAGQTKTFEIRGTVTGASTTGDSISTSLTKDAAALAGGTVARTETLAGGGVNDASTDANNLFIWSDKSADTHGLTSTEWANSFNLVGWPSSGQTLSVS